MSTDCENLLRKFLVLNPAKRASLEVIMRDKWMNMGHEEEELKPFIEPLPDLKDVKRIGKTGTVYTQITNCWCHVLLFQPECSCLFFPEIFVRTENVVLDLIITCDNYFCIVVTLLSLNRMPLTFEFTDFVHPCFDRLHFLLKCCLSELKEGGQLYIDQF